MERTLPDADADAGAVLGSGAALGGCWGRFLRAPGEVVAGTA